MVRGRVETAVGTMCDLCIREPDDLSHGARGFVIVVCCSEVFGTFFRFKTPGNLTSGEER